MLAEWRRFLNTCPVSYLSKYIHSKKNTCFHVFWKSFLQQYVFIQSIIFFTDRPATTSKKTLGFFMALPGTPRNGSDLLAGMLRSSEGFFQHGISWNNQGWSEQYSTFNLTWHDIFHMKCLITFKGSKNFLMGSLYFDGKNNKPLYNMGSIQNPLQRSMWFLPNVWKIFHIYPT